MVRLALIILLSLTSNAVLANANEITNLQAEKIALEMRLHAVKGELSGVGQQWHAVIVQRNRDLAAIWANYQQTINKNKPPYEEAMKLYMQAKTRAAQIKDAAAQKIYTFRAEYRQIFSQMDVIYKRISDIEMRLSQLMRLEYLKKHPRNVHRETFVRTAPHVNHHTTVLTHRNRMPAHRAINLQINRPRQHPKIYNLKTQQASGALPLTEMN